tara:strand:- start:1902 stop:2084 length:183 start_codon:yes stop_codon:yes gene_type:complete
MHALLGEQRGEWRIGSIKAHALCSQALQMRRLYHRVPVHAGEGGGHLVGDDKKNIRSVAH